MAQLFGNSVFDELIASSEDVMDTMAKMPITINYTTSSNFSRDGRSHNRDLSLNLLGLIVWDSKDKVEVERHGKIDVSEGYCLFKYSDFESNSLTGNEGAVIIPEGNAEALVDGENCEVLSFTPVGPAGTKYVLVKMFIKRKLKA